MEDSYNLIFLDINNIIFDEIFEINEGENLKEEVKEKFEFISSIIKNFVDNHILVDIENEENYIFQSTSFIYQIENEIMKKYKFFLFRKFNENVNIQIDAFFIIMDLEKEYSKESFEKIIDIIINNSTLKIYILGIYRSKNDIVITKEIIEDFLKKQNCQIDHKYTEININNEDKDEINDTIEKFIEEAMFDVHIKVKEDKIKDGINNTYNSKDKGENDSKSFCMIF